MTLRKDADYIIKKSIEAVLLDEAVHSALKDKDFKNVYLVSEGKAAWSMANTAKDVLSDVKDGIVITKYEHVKGNIEGVQCYEAGHPVPDKNTFKATQKVIDMVSNLNKDYTVVYLLSGGGSALF